MANLKINIESKELVRVTNRLARAGRTALPNAVKGTLNSAAFDVKKNTMPKSVKKTFTEREKTFFKSTSRVNMATGSRIEDLKSVVGFYAGQGKKETGRATKNLEQQEEGGQIGGRSFVPTDKARVSNSANKSVKTASRLGKITGIENAEKVKFINASKRPTAPIKPKKITKKAAKSRQFTIAAIRAKAKSDAEAYVLGHEGKKGVRMLYKIESVSTDRKTGKVVIKKKAQYAYRKNRKAGIKKTGFMKRAANETHLNIGAIYQKEAIRQLKKLNLM